MKACTKLRFKGLKFKMFYGKLGDQDFDPWLWKWNARDPKELTRYCAKQGRKMFKSRKELICNVLETSAKDITLDLQSMLKKICIKHKTKKDVGFLWSLWH